MASVKIVNTPSDLVPTPGLAHEQVTVSSTALTLVDELTAGELNSATTHVLVQVNGADVRIVADGANAATGSLGFLYVDGTSAVFRREFFEKISVIRDASTDAVLEIQELSH